MCFFISSSTEMAVCCSVVATLSFYKIICAQRGTFIFQALIISVLFASMFKKFRLFHRNSFSLFFFFVFIFQCLRPPMNGPAFLHFQLFYPLLPPPLIGYSKCLVLYARTRLFDDECINPHANDPSWLTMCTPMKLMCSLGGFRKCFNDPAERKRVPASMTPLIRQ